MVNEEILKAAFDEIATDNVLGDPDGKPAFAYIRVSTDDQAYHDSYSISMRQPTNMAIK